VKISRADGEYEIDITSKKLKPLNTKLLDLSLFEGLPEESNTVLNSIAVLNPDKSRALVISMTLDENNEASEFDGSVPVLSASEFLCDTIDKKCEPSNIFKAAHEKVGSKSEWFNDHSIKWHGLNTNKSILYGSPVGSSGNVSPVYAYDYSNDLIQQTSGYDSSRTTDKIAAVPSGAFSPSLGKFVTIYSFSDKWYLYLYDSGNISEPLKKIDITLAKDDADEDNLVDSVTWSPDEKILALVTDNQIYTLNIDNEQITLRYNDIASEEISADVFEQGMDSSSVRFSSGGKYIVFIDYEVESVIPDEGKFNTALKAVELEGDNLEAIELLKEEGLSLE
jgi:hypothetical protein